MLQFINLNLEKIKIVIFSFGITSFFMSMMLLIFNGLSFNMQSILTWFAVVLFFISTKAIPIYRSKVKEHNQKMKELIEEYNLTRENIGDEMYSNLNKVFDKYIERKIFLPREEVDELLSFLSKDLSMETYHSLSIIVYNYTGYFRQKEKTFKISRKETLKSMKEFVYYEKDRKDAYKESSRLMYYNETLEQRNSFFGFIE